MASQYKSSWLGELTVFLRSHAGPASHARSSIDARDWDGCRGPWQWLPAIHWLLTTSDHFGLELWAMCTPTSASRLIGVPPLLRSPSCFKVCWSYLTLGGTRCHE